MIVILYSGGLDSLIMKKWAEVKRPKEEVKCVYFNIGHKYAHKELAVLPPDVEVYDMSWFAAKEFDKDGNASGGIFIPGRNLLFATLAASKYVPDEIWLGSLLGETHAQATDKNWKFAHGTSDLFDYTFRPYLKDRRMMLRYPLAEAGLDKLDATKWALEQGMEKEILASSSCMDGEDGNCGKCVVCIRRWGIFKQLGLKEDYRCDPLKVPEHIDMMKEMIATEIAVKAGVKTEDEVHYDHHRRREIIPALMSEFKSVNLDELWSKVDGC